MGKKNKLKRVHVNKYAGDSKAEGVALALDASEKRAAAKAQALENMIYCPVREKDITRARAATCVYLHVGKCSYYTFARPCSAVRR